VCPSPHATNVPSEASRIAAAASAATIEGTSQFDAIHETNRNDTIFGRGGGDFISAVDFSDDRDVVYGNAGGDEIHVDDGDGRDTANGGSGVDTCFGDPGDTFISC